jgi:hypothetical protein
MGAWLIAVAVAGVQALAGFPYSRYMWWNIWLSRRAYVFFFAIYLIFAGVGGALVGRVIAFLSKVNTTGNWALDGVLYGAVGTIAIRASFGSSVRSTPNPKKVVAYTSHSFAMNQTISLLGGWIRWIEDALDKRAEAGIADWVYAAATKGDAHLLQISSKVWAHIRKRDDMNAQQRKGPLEIIKEARDGLNVPETRGDAVNQLVVYCADYMTSQQMDKRLVQQDEKPGAAITAAPNAAAADAGQDPMSTPRIPRDD